MEEESPNYEEIVPHLEQAYDLEEQEEYDDALDECDAAIELAHAFLAEAYNLRGILLEELDRPVEAREAYNSALAMVPGYQDAVDNLLALEEETGLSSEPVTIARYLNMAEADLARGHLEAEGIEAFVAGDYAASTIGVLGTGGIGLQVREEDVARALEILGIEAEEEGEVPEDAVVCPNCQSLDVRMPILGNEWRCNECGHRWEL